MRRSKISYSIMGLIGAALILSSCGSSSSSGGSGGSGGESDSTAADASSEVAVGPSASAGSSGAAAASGGAAALRVALKGFEFPINEEISQEMPCSSGEGGITGSVVGTVDADQNGLNSLEATLTMAGTATDCVPEQNADFIMNGSLDGNGTVSLNDEGMIALDLTVTGTFNPSGAACAEGGELNMEIVMAATAPVPEQMGGEPDFTGTTTVTITGTACGTTFDCNGSGDFNGEPTLSGTGCE